MVNWDLYENTDWFCYTFFIITALIYQTLKYENVQLHNWPVDVTIMLYGGGRGDCYYFFIGSH